MPTYLGFRCRSREKSRRTDKERPAIECQGLVGGPSTETLLAHDFSKGPFQDARQCSICRTWHLLTIRSLVDIPRLVAKPKGERMDIVPAEEYFGAVEYLPSPVEPVVKHQEANG